MKRREFITLLGGAAAARPFAARAQRIDRTMRRVGVLMPFAPDDPEARMRVAALEQGLRDLGWVDSRNLRIDYRWATDDPDRLRGEAAAVVAAAPDVIIANSTPVLSELRKQSTTLPMVFVQVTDPLGSGFVPNLARPGGDPPVSPTSSLRSAANGCRRSRRPRRRSSGSQSCSIRRPRHAEALLQPTHCAGGAASAAGDLSPILTMP